MSASCGYYSQWPKKALPASRQASIERRSGVYLEVGPQRELATMASRGEGPRQHRGPYLHPTMVACRGLGEEMWWWCERWRGNMVAMPVSCWGLAGEALGGRGPRVQLLLDQSTIYSPAALFVP